MEKPAVSCEAPPNIEFGAKRILVFSTEPEGRHSCPPKSATLPLPEGEETLYSPESIAVDPSSHDVVVLAENIEERATVQRIGSAGAIGARFVDTGDELRPVGKEAASLAVGPDGTTYTLTGAPNAMATNSPAPGSCRMTSLASKRSPASPKQPKTRVGRPACSR